jgi:lysyl-tRNA synthetase class 2
MKTKQGRALGERQSFTLLSKALRPLPEKWHGLSDTDTRYRQRYVDLIANDDARRVFAIRFAASPRCAPVPRERGYVEVETPVLHPIAGGATARRSSRTTTRSTSTSTCASRPSST